MHCGSDPLPERSYRPQTQSNRPEVSGAALSRPSFRPHTCASRQQDRGPDVADFWRATGLRPFFLAAIILVACGVRSPVGAPRITHVVKRAMRQGEPKSAPRALGQRHACGRSVRGCFSLCDLIEPLADFWNRSQRRDAMIHRPNRDCGCVATELPGAPRESN